MILLMCSILHKWGEVSSTTSEGDDDEKNSVVLWSKEGLFTSATASSFAATLGQLKSEEKKKMMEIRNTQDSIKTSI